MAPRRRGAIVNTASELAILGEAGYVAYTATKGRDVSMTRALAAEMAQYGIRVNAVCSGAVDTPLLASEFAASSDPAAEREEMEQSIAIGRFAQPTEIADRVVFLLRPLKQYDGRALLRGYGLSRSAPRVRKL